MRTAWSGSLRAFVLDTRASAVLELAIGAVALVSVAVLCFNLYARAESDTAAARVAATMADYVSRGPDTDGGTLDGDALKELGKFLNKHEVGHADIVFVVSAFKQPAGNPPPAVNVLWSDDTVRVGDATVTTTLAGDCARFVKESNGTTTATLPADFTLDAGEVAVVVELCARPGGMAGTLAGDIYRHHVLPVRVPERAFPAPVYSRWDGAGDTEALA